MRRTAGSAVITTACALDTTDGARVGTREVIGDSDTLTLSSWTPARPSSSTA